MTEKSETICEVCNTTFQTEEGEIFGTCPECKLMTHFEREVVRGLLRIAQTLEDA